MEPRQRILNDILAERVIQTDRYSNTHDDGNTRSKRWKGLLIAYIGDLESSSYKITRKRLVQIAAICVCAIESIDRLTGKHHE